jgi:hypothetical protein
MRRFAVDRKARDLHGAVTVPWSSALGQYFSTADELIGLVSPEAVKTLSPIRRSSILASPSGVFIRVPDRKQLFGFGETHYALPKTTPTPPLRIVSNQR